MIAAATTNPSLVRRSCLCLCLFWTLQQRRRHAGGGGGGRGGVWAYPTNGPITIYLVNDSPYNLTAVWLNQLRVSAPPNLNSNIYGEDDEGDEEDEDDDEEFEPELIPITTGPIQPGTIEKYRAYPYDGIELQKYDEDNDDCGSKKGSAQGKEEAQCMSAYVKVKKASGDSPTNIIVVSPNFQATSEAVLDPTFLIKAIREGTNIDATIRIHNNNAKAVNLFWVSSDDKSLVPMNEHPIVPRGEGQDDAHQPYYFSASIYHQFLLKEECDEVEGEECGMRYLRVAGKEIEITISPNFVVEMQQLEYDPLSRFVYRPGIDLYQQCHDHVRPELNFEHPDTIMKTIEQCIRDHWREVDWGAQHVDPNDTKMQQKYMNYKMENYVCDETRMKTTAPVEIELWRNNQQYDNYRMRTIFVLHETPTSQIHLISNFVTKDECQALETVAENNNDENFEPTKTSDGKGGFRLNPIRKAHIARVDVPWDDPEDLVTRTGRRIFDYMNHIHPSLGITHEGQEPIQAIRYYGRGRNVPNPDQYRAHCDADCNGQEVQEGQRVATMVMYCETPTEGGHTNFRNAHVHVKPQVGNAIFFSYVNAATKKSDNGLTIHSGCPVYEGTKKIFTQWIRYGVNYENPHTDYPILPN